jgi:hypothetical protein
MGSFAGAVVAADHQSVDLTLEVPDDSAAAAWIRRGGSVLDFAPGAMSSCALTIPVAGPAQTCEDVARGVARAGLEPA